jgi:hypothetical protein
MIRTLLAVAAVAFPLAAAQAQQTEHRHAPGMTHDMPGMTSGTTQPTQATEPGQGAFAAIQEIVDLLMADPNTDWSKVNIDGLRRHLVDMSNVTLYAEAAATPVPNGMRYLVTGTGAIRDSIRRMVTAHAQTMSGTNGMTMTAQEAPEGATLTVTVANPHDLAKLKGLGFFGIMALGMHHQAHHLMIATGQAPHE